MDEIMKHDTVQPVAESTEPETEAAAGQKPQSLKAARTALKRMESDLEKKNEQIAALRKEITELKPQIRDMKTQIEILEQEETLKKVQDAMRTKSKRMTSTQVQAALNLVQQINGDLEHMDIDEIAGIIHERVTGKKTVREAALPKVETNINLSEQTDTQETEE